MLGIIVFLLEACFVMNEDAMPDLFNFEMGNLHEMG